MDLVPVDRISLQQLLRPIIICDRQLCVLNECLSQLLDASDFLDGQGALHSLDLTIQHLERTIQLVRISKMLKIVHLQRCLHLQWRHHGVVAPVDWMIDE